MRINLMPSIPISRRYYPLWVGLIILFLLSLVAASIWIWKYQQDAIVQMRKKVTQLAPMESEINRKVKIQERHAAVLAFQEAADHLRKERIPWETGMEVLDKALPPGAQVFNLRVQGNRLEGMGAFSTLEGVALFTERIKKDEQVESFFLDGVDQGDAASKLKVEPQSTNVVYFHLTLRAPVQETVELKEGNW